MRRLRVTRITIGGALGILALTALAGCGSNGIGPANGKGSIKVTTATGGGDLPPGTFTVSLDGGQSKMLGLQDSVTYDSVAAGTHTVALAGVPMNCGVGGGASQSVTVTKGALATAALTVTCVHWQLAFESSAAGAINVFRMFDDGSGRVQLTTDTSFAGLPVVSPDGSKIAFASTGDSANLDVYVMKSNGSLRQRLTTLPAQDAFPDWSPDGTRIAFSSDRSGSINIWVMNADGSNPTPLTADASTDNGPAWSPDGTQIAFLSNRTGTDQVFVMNSDGTNVRQVTTSGTNSSPHWSPDGTKLIYETSSDGSHFAIATIALDGSGAQSLTSTSGNSISDEQPVYAPDGSRIAFMSTRAGSNYQVYVMNADGSGITRVSNNGANEGYPSWFR